MNYKTEVLETIKDAVREGVRWSYMPKRFIPYDTQAVRPSGFDSFGEFCVAVRKAERGQGTDSRLKALSEGIPSAGGYLVPEEFRRQLMAETVEESFFRQYATVLPMATNTLKVPRIVDTSHASSLFGGVVCYWMSEGSTKTESEPEFGSISLQARKLIGYTVVSDELLADSVISLDILLRRLFSQAIAYYEEDAFINGTGAGQPLGILNSSALVTVDKESGQTARTIVVQNIVKMYSRMLPGSVKKAVWLANPDIRPQLYTMSLTVAQGGSAVYLPAGGLSAAPFDTLMGRPIFYTEKCPSLGNKGDIIFADLSYYLIGDRGGLRIDSSMHVHFAQDKTAFRFVQRVDGQPWLDSPITPKHGTNTLSPFVCLAERL